MSIEARLDKLEAAGKPEDVLEIWIESGDHLFHGNDGRVLTRAELDGLPDSDGMTRIIAAYHKEPEAGASEATQKEEMT